MLMETDETRQTEHPKKTCCKCGSGLEGMWKESFIAASRIVSSLRPRDHVTCSADAALATRRPWNPLQYKMCLFVCKTLVGQLQEYLANLLTHTANVPVPEGVALYERAATATLT